MVSERTPTAYYGVWSEGRIRSVADRRCSVCDLRRSGEARLESYPPHGHHLSNLSPYWIPHSHLLSSLGSAFWTARGWNSRS